MKIYSFHDLMILANIRKESLLRIKKIKIKTPYVNAKFVKIIEVIGYLFSLLDNVENVNINLE